MPFINYKNKNILFIHIPKTGGTSVEAWMSSLGSLHFRTIGVPGIVRCTPQHFRMSDLDLLFAKPYFDYAFSIVRNPYSRIESDYRMRAKLQANGFFGEAQPFSLWLENAMERVRRDRWLFDNHLRPQWEFIEDNVEVFRFEDGLEDVLRRVSDRIGAEPPDSMEQALRVGDCIPRVEWTRTDKLRVQDYYARDFECFGYGREIDDSDVVPEVVVDASEASAQEPERD